MKIAVAGTGYVGLVTAVVLSEIGHEVICVDVDENKIKMMQADKSPIYEEGLEELMIKNRERLLYTSDYKSAYNGADVIFIGVGTPEREDGSANLDYVFQVARQIAESITNDCIIVVKSTVPIGTNEKVEEIIRDIVKNNFEIHVVSNPEFLAQGTAVRDSLYASRIVVGVNDDKAKEIMRELYKPLTEEPYNVPYLTMNRKSAEMVKYASNDFLALKISYINEISNFCEKIGADITEVTAGMSYDQRIGSKFLNSGIGYGGSCFGKDTKALHWLSVQEECELKTVKACIEVNKNQKIRLFRKFKNDYNNEIQGKKVAVLGATFKPGTDDLRDAPSIENIKLLLEHGCEVSAYDPIGLENLKKVFGEQILYYTNIDECIRNKDVTFIMTEWKTIKNYDLKNYKVLMNDAVVYDGRNCYSLENAEEAGIIYISMGRKRILL